MDIKGRLTAIETVVKSGLDREKTYQVLKLLSAQEFVQADLLDEFKLYDEYLPQIEVMPFTLEQKYLHLLWELFDKLPISIAINFAIPFRRILAQRLFKRCGRNFIALEGIRFNFGQNIEVGDDVFINRGVFLDSKGGIAIGNYVALAERVEIYTHMHSEFNHRDRTYAPVKVCDFAKAFLQATLLPGVVVGEQAIIAAKAVVNKDVEPNTLVAGIPAKPVRKRKNLGKKGRDLGHVWFHNSAFQTQ